MRISQKKHIHDIFTPEAAVNRFTKSQYKDNLLTHEASHHLYHSDIHEYVQLNSLMRLIQAFVSEKLLSSIHQGNKLIFLLPHNARTLYVDNISMGSLARFSAFGNVYIHDKNGSSHQIRSPLELLEIFISELNLESDRQNWEKLQKEVSDHVRNAVLSSY